MIQISPAQISALAEPMARAYEWQLVRDFQRQHPKSSAELGEARLHQVVCQSVARAQAAAVSSSGALLRYVSLAVLVHPDFDQRPEVQALMQAPGMDADYKVHLLSDIFIAGARVPAARRHLHPPRHPAYRRGR